jgi:hypothetical protein
MNKGRLINDLRQLSYIYRVALDDDSKFIIVGDFNLPPGYNRGQIPVKLTIPSRYPESAPGIGSAKVYFPSYLRYRGRKPRDFHDGSDDKWAWWCYERIDWNPCRDNFIRFFEMLRTHMTNPKVE